MSTIVILVLAMSMLILGLVLVRTIFTGAKYNVDTMNEKVKGEIGKLFVEETRAVLYLSNRMAEINQGDSFGAGFGIQNTVKTQEFSWKVEVADSKIKDKCGISAEEAANWITAGGDGKVNLASGQKYTDVIRFTIPEGAVTDVSTCVIRFRLVITQADGTAYTTEPFDVDIK